MGAAESNASLLKLRANDAEDTQVVSAVLQDAIVPVCDIAYNPKDQTFVMVAQRLRRERGTEGAATRICCALTAKGVQAVQTLGIDQQQNDRILDLLAIMLDGTSLNLVFAGDARIRLDLGDWALAVEDFGEPWPAMCNPCHDDAIKAQ